MTLWKVLYSPMDLGALIIAAAGLLLHAIYDFTASRRGQSSGDAQKK